MRNLRLPDAERGWAPASYRRPPSSVWRRWRRNGSRRGEADFLRRWQPRGPRRPGRAASRPAPAHNVPSGASGRFSERTSCVAASSPAGEAEAETESERESNANRIRMRSRPSSDAPSRRSRSRTNGASSLRKVRVRGAVAKLDEITEGVEDVEVGKS